MLVLGHGDVARLLDGQDKQVLEAVREAYLRHAEGRGALPHSVFLRFPGRPRDRIIGLPAYLDGEPGVAGIKWIASFPGNHDLGLPRASALIVLNDTATGRPEVVLEGSIVSARRTGAGAALAAGALPGSEPDEGVGLIGCGVINFEVLRFLLAGTGGLARVALFDALPERVDAFAARCAATWPELAVERAASLEDALGRHRLVSFATTAAEPHTGLDACRAGTLVLHVSLRDLTPQAMLSSVNVVDDADHVFRERTSLHLAEQLTGGRDFVHGTIAGLLAAPRRREQDRVTVVSPFGLGVLDLAVARLVVEEAVRRGAGVRVEGFSPGTP